MATTAYHVHRSPAEPTAFGTRTRVPGRVAPRHPNPTVPDAPDQHVSGVRGRSRRRVVDHFRTQASPCLPDGGSPIHEHNVSDGRPTGLHGEPGIGSPVLVNGSGPDGPPGYQSVYTFTVNRGGQASGPTGPGIGGFAANKSGFRRAALQ